MTPTPNGRTDAPAPSGGADHSGGDESVDALRATLAVTPATPSSCHVIYETPDASAVTRTVADGPDGPRCQSAVTAREDGTERARYRSEPVSDRCLCTALTSVECAFSVDSVRDGALILSLTVPSRSALADAVDALRAVDAQVRLRRVGRLEAGEPDRIELDPASVTDKQREAVELALELGYYERPRRADLSDLAAALDVSPSAVSQRLTAVEATLVRSLARA